MDQTPLNNTPPSESSPVSASEITIEVRKSNTLLHILSFIALIAGILFIPIPFRYKTSVLCQPCITLSQCPPCPQEGDIGWGPSIGKQIATQLNSQFSNRPATNGVRVVPPSPTPSPVADETSTWKLYSNSKYGYSLRYPQDFVLAEESEERVLLSNNLPPDPNCQGGGCNVEIPHLTFYFEHLGNPGEDALSLDEYAKERRRLLLNIDNNQGEIQALEKFGYPMKYFDGITEGYNHNYVLKVIDNMSFSITVVFPSKEESARYVALESQILSTFKLFEPRQTQEFICPANGWVNCMQVLDAVGQKACASQAIQWYKANCPNFQGIAR